MVTERTLYRKLQKKKKRKQYRKCPFCSGRMVCRIIDKDHKIDAVHYAIEVECKKPYGCGFSKELGWSGR